MGSTDSIEEIDELNQPHFSRIKKKGRKKFSRTCARKNSKNCQRKKSTIARWTTYGNIRLTING